MSEDRLEKALQAMREENASPDQLAGARDRVRERLENPGAALCSEFQPDFRDYLDGRLAATRRLLIEDHLSRCAACRAQLAREKGEGKVYAIPRRRTVLPKWAAWVAAAAVLFAAVYLGRGSLDRLLAPRGARATVASLSGELHLVHGGMLKKGSEIREGEAIRTSPGARAVLRLRDGSLIDVNERAELSLHATWSGQAVRLQSGDVIVKAAKQRRGHLRVQTRDSVASVKGTVFAVSAGFNGSVVSVAEGSVAVSQPGSEVLLGPGEQAASNPALAIPVEEAFAWSPDAETYLEILTGLSKIEKQLASATFPVLRTESALLQFMPAGMVVYGAVPNLSGTIDQAVGLAEQQSAESPAFSQWWNSGAGEQLKKLIGRIQTVAPLLGDEIVYGLCLNPQADHPVPVLLAEIRSGKRAELEAALQNLGAGPEQNYHLSDTLLTVSASAANLQWLHENMGQGAATPFAGEIAARYRDGAAWLLGIDMDSLLSLSDANRNSFIHDQQLKYVFLEQRSSQGREENKLTVSFKGVRKGLASILASTGSGGAAEYLSSEATVAVYASTREPQQLFDELVAQIASVSPDFRNSLSEAEEKVRISFSNDLAYALGTESAFSIDSLSTAGPVWTMAILVNDSVVLDSVIQRLVDAANAELARAGKSEYLAIAQENVDGRSWKTLKIPGNPLGITWTYDRGYLVAGSDRGVASRAIAVRNGGTPLVWSPEFQRLLSPSAGLHPSGFAWVNTRGAFASFSSMISNPALRQLAEERDPILVLFSGTMEQIRAVSRTRLSGLIMNLMLLQGLNRAQTGTQPAAALPGPLNGIERS